MSGRNGNGQHHGSNGNGRNGTLTHAAAGAAVAATAPQSGATNGMRVTPRNIEAEQAVLGAALLDNGVMSEIAVNLEAEDFFHEPHRLIYGAMIELYDHEKPIDYVTVHDELAKQHAAVRAGGVEYLMELVDRVPAAANGPYYADLIRRTAILRNLISTTNELNREAYEHSGDMAEYLDTVEQRIFSITQRDVGVEPKTVLEVMRETFKRLEVAMDTHARGDRSVTGIAVGIPDLDEALNGLQDAEEIILAARPSVGKTSCLLRMSGTVAARSTSTRAIATSRPRCCSRVR